MPTAAVPDPELLQHVKAMIRRDLKLGPDATIPDDMPFFGGEVDLDSLDMLLLVTSIEKEFGLKVPSEAVGREVFQNVGTLARYIQANGSGARPGGTAAAVSSGAPANPIDRLPHRDPFRFVTKITGHVPGESATGTWAVSGSEAFFAGHFPGQPVVPGVLISEALAQISGIAGPSTGSASERGRLVHVDVRFDASATPPAEIVLSSRVNRVIGPLQQFDVSATLNGTVIARVDHAPSVLNMTRRWAILLLGLIAAAPATRPALEERLVEIDRRGSAVQDLTADFSQKKFTPLLRKPLVSAGVIRVRGAAMVWDTKTPEPTQMRIDPEEIRLYYPRQETLEVYPMDRQLGSLAASPLPRLDVLKKYFSFEEVAVTDEPAGAKGLDLVALKLTPIDAMLREHLDRVVVLLDAGQGLIMRAEMVDADGDRTQIVFSNVRVNTGLREQDVKLDVPASTKVSRPLDGLGTSPPPSRRK